MLFCCDSEPRVHPQLVQLIAVFVERHGPLRLRPWYGIILSSSIANGFLVDYGTIFSSTVLASG